MLPLRSAVLLLASTLLASQTATAQTYTPYPVQPQSDADLLAGQVRALAANPQDLNALLRAGELAVKLGDTTAAAAFFTRAGRIDPRNPRIKAGEGSLLVAAERPGEALRRFAEAESLGGDPRQFAADRGLAYDLIGENERAQRDYRLALRGGVNDETQRRYALSLGIAGKLEPALQQIGPLLRRSDRGAWRARAFILAMNGDGGGAERIATSMMPGGMAQGLQPFFAILPTLPAADRAFAVHFGEVRATPERAFDRRLVPPLAALGPDPTAPIAVAALARPSIPLREERRRKRRRDRVELAAVTTPAPVPLPQPPAYRSGVTASAPPPPRAAPVQLAAVKTPLPQRSVPSGPILPPATAAARAVVPPALGVRTPFVVSYAPPPRVAIMRAEPVVPAMAVTSAPPPATIVFAAAPAPPEPVRVSVPAASPAPLPIARSPLPPTPTPVRSEDSILSSILADLVVPASELDAEPVRAVPKPVRVAKPKPAVPDAEIAAKVASDKKAADKKLADKKAADKKLADAKLAAEAKKHDPKLLEPSRVWVQVAGGAIESGLAKAWNVVRAKSPAAFKGKAAWTTPLRATNRVLAGPFKSGEEAQSFVNTIAKDGVSGFVFTSTAGQKIDKLAAK